MVRHQLPLHRPRARPGHELLALVDEAFDEHAEAMEELGIDTVPVLLGPVSLLLLGKPADGVDGASTASTC